MIQRRKDYSKKVPSKEASKIYIVCEGKETETNYFEFFEGLSSNLHLIIIPPENGKTDPLKLMEQAKKLFMGKTRLYTLDYLQNDKVWFAIDTDTWEIEGKIQPLRDFCALQNDLLKEFNERKPYKAWNVAQSNPCIEIWLYYHFYDVPPQEDEIRIHPSMKSYVDSKVAGGFDYQKDPVRVTDSALNSSSKASNENSAVSLYDLKLLNFKLTIILENHTG